MKSGRPEYWIPSHWTVSRDVQQVFARTHTRIGQMLQVSIHTPCTRQICDIPELQAYDGELNFTTDCWTLPNHKAMVAFSVRFEHDGAPMRMVLDVVELAKSHSGMNLAVVFADLLKSFGVESKVSVFAQHQVNKELTHQW